jgi:hypothetical protein
MKSRTRATSGVPKNLSVWSPHQPRARITTAGNNNWKTCEIEWDSCGCLDVTAPSRELGTPTHRLRQARHVPGGWMFGAPADRLGSMCKGAVAVASRIGSPSPGAAVGMVPTSRLRWLPRPPSQSIRWRDRDRRDRARDQGRRACGWDKGMTAPCVLRPRVDLQ